MLTNVTKALIVLPVIVMASVSVHISGGGSIDPNLLFILTCVFFGVVNLLVVVTLSSVNRAHMLFMHYIKSESASQENARFEVVNSPEELEELLLKVRAEMDEARESK